MAQQPEAVFPRYFRLLGFYGVAVKFHGVPAALTNQMIVMRVDRHGLKSCDPVAELQFQRKIGLAQQFERAIYRRLTDTRLALSDEGIKLLQGMMSGQGKEKIRDLQPLPGDVHAPFPHVLQKLILIAHGLSGELRR